MSALVALALAGASLTLAGPAPTTNVSKSIDWEPCGLTNAPTAECATVWAPLNYENAADARTVNIAVLKVPASAPVKERLGTIYLNFGGPGGSGVSTLPGFSTVFSKMLSGRYDLVAHDPRGVGSSGPDVGCFDSVYEEEAFKWSTGLTPQALDFPADPSAFPDVHNDLQRQVRNRAVAQQALGKRCARRNGDNATHTGSEYVVKDIRFLATLDHVKIINYWGFSYGTAIGQLLVQTLPRAKIGKVIIDGVQNAQPYVTDPTDMCPGCSQGADGQLRQLAKYCVESKNTTKCALADIPADQIVQRIHKLLDDLYRSPKAYVSQEIVGTLSTTQLRSWMSGSLYRPAQWRGFAEQMRKMLKGDFSPLAGFLVPPDPDDAERPDLQGFSFDSVFANDMRRGTKAQTSPQAIAQKYLASVKQSGAVFGSTFWWQALSNFFPLPSGSRFGGKFSMAANYLKTPMLIISSTYDPVTGLVEGLAVNKRMATNSRLLEQKGSGHCSTAQYSSCTARYIRNYWLHGTLPRSKHVYCAVDSPNPFTQVKTNVQLAEEAAIPDDDDDLELQRAWATVADELILPRPRGR